MSEKDALTLEATLINKHKPYYNILLKDDKHSPYIKIDLREDFPTIEVTRKFKRDGAKYFGPYFGGVAVKELVEIIRSAYNMRTCPRALRKKKRACLNYDIGLCKAPCMGYVTKEEYDGIVEQVIKFLSGYDNTAAQIIRKKMEIAAENEQFERAITYRDRLEMLRKMKERTIANLGSATDIDAFEIASEGDDSVVSVAIVRGSKMMGVKNYFLETPESEEEDKLTQFLLQYYEMGEIPPEILLPERFDTENVRSAIELCDRSKKIDLRFPQRGQRRKLVDMARENAFDYLVKNREQNKRETERTVGAVRRLAAILGIKSARRMECFDISHVSGTDKVASQVVSIDGAPAKSEYRRYKIKTVEGNNDFECMAEVIRRRLSHLADGEAPDLIVVDGGKGQLSYAEAVMKEMGVDIPLVSLAEREEEIFVPWQDEPIVLSKSDFALQAMIRLRDEAHRFAITYHRNLRAKRIGSELEKIEGVGEVRRKILLKAFGSVTAIKEAPLTALLATAGIDERTARAVYNHYHKED